MELNIISIILAMAFIYPIIRGYLVSFSSVGLKKDITSSEGDIGFVSAIFIGLFLLRRIFVQQEQGIYIAIYNAIPAVLTTYIEDKPYLLYLVVLPIMVLVVYEVIKMIFYLINMAIIFPALDVLEASLEKRSSAVKRFISAIFEIPRALCYVILLTVIFNIAAFMNINPQLNNHLSVSKIYNYICKDIIVPIANSKLARQIPNIINNSMKIEIKEASNGTGGNDTTIIYYNGITLDEGVKSNDEIDYFTRQLTKGAKSSNEKAKLIYEWIGKNLEYDNDKAQEILNNNFSAKSGAISAFKEKKGICFDFSCLYVAMCRAVDIDVRMITGEGFNGVSWVSHAWNQAFIDNRWVNVDTTFYKGGDYYNSNRFGIDHRNSAIAGEWKKVP